MKMTAFGAFEIEGEPQELAAFVFVMLEVMKMKEEKDKEEQIHREMELFEKFENMTFGEMMKKEREDNDDD